MNAEHDHLASAYLDGELTAEERSIAEADPAIMAEVDELRALQGEIANVAPPADQVRSAAIGAAMDAFHALHHVAHTPALTPARRSPRWLGVAAAALVIGLLGVVVAIGVGSRDDDDSAAEPAQDADEPAEPMSDVAAEEPASEPAADDAAGSTESADVLAEADARAEMLIAEEPASEPAPAAAEEPAEEAAEEPAASVDAPAHLEGLPMTTPDQLAAVGRHLLDLIETHQLPPTPEHSCPFSDVLADGVYAEQGPTDVYIAVDAEHQRVLAIGRTTCEVVVETPLP